MVDSADNGFKEAGRAANYLNKFYGKKPRKLHGTLEHT